MSKILLSLSALLFAYCDLRFLCLPQRQGVFSSWKQYSTNFKRHKWSFMPYIVSFSALKMALSKLSLAKYCCLHKKPYIFHVFNYYSSSLQISLFYKFFFTNLSQVVLKRVLHGFYNTICMTLIWLIFSYKSEKIEFIWSFKNRIIHISMQKVAMILQFTHSD